MHIQLCHTINKHWLTLLPYFYVVFLLCWYIPLPNTGTCVQLLLYKKPVASSPISYFVLIISLLWYDILYNNILVKSNRQETGGIKGPNNFVICFQSVRQVTQPMGTVWEIHCIVHWVECTGPCGSNVVIDVGLSDDIACGVVNFHFELTCIQMIKE